MKSTTEIVVAVATVAVAVAVAAAAVAVAVAAVAVEVAVVVVVVERILEETDSPASVPTKFKDASNLQDSSDAVWSLWEPGVAA